MMRFQFEFTSVLIVLQTISICIGFIPESPNSLLKDGNLEETK